METVLTEEMLFELNPAWLQNYMAMNTSQLNSFILLAEEQILKNMYALFTTNFLNI
jgi:hypothetical protein